MLRLIYKFAFNKNTQAKKYIYLLAKKEKKMFTQASCSEFKRTNCIHLKSRNYTNNVELGNMRNTQVLR